MVQPQAFEIDAHLLVGQRIQQASGSEIVESRDRRNIMSAPDRVVLIEGCGEMHIREAAAHFFALTHRLEIMQTGTGFYQLEYQCGPR
jgi:hypothetical protein